MSDQDRARLAELEAENKRLQKEAEERKTAERHTGHQAFADGLIREGKLLPAHRPFVVAFMDHVAADAGVIEFGEGADKKSQAGIDGFKAFMAAQPKQVEFKEVAKPEGQSASVEFAAPPGYDVDAERLETHHKALAYAEQHKVDYVVAVKAVSAA